MHTAVDRGRNRVDQKNKWIGPRPPPYHKDKRRTRKDIRDCGRFPLCGGLCVYVWYTPKTPGGRTGADAHPGPVTSTCFFVPPFLLLSHSTGHQIQNVTSENESRKSRKRKQKGRDKATRRKEPPFGDEGRGASRAPSAERRAPSADGCGGEALGSTAAPSDPSGWLVACLAMAMVVLRRRTALHRRHRWAASRVPGPMYVRRPAPSLGGDFERRRRFELFPRRSFLQLYYLLSDSFKLTAARSR